MNQNLTEMVFILDMSGSMWSLTSDTIGGYNTLINNQKKEKGDANVTTVLFNDKYMTLHDRANIKDVKEMTDREYSPCGSTAMLDAIGNTITSIGKKLAEMPEADRPGSVIVTIITDGYENRSREYTWNQVKEMITHQREKYNWVFTFIGANIDTMVVGNNLGIDARLSKSYTANSRGVDSVYKSVSKATTMAREATACGQSVHSACFMDSLSDVLDEVE